MFGHWWQQIVLSYEVQSMKPAAHIYEVCEQRAGCQARDIFFTDDREENIAAAADRGWATYHFTSAETLVERLGDWIES